MSAFRIPTTAYPDTTQRTQLGTSTYSMRIRWSERGESWHLDLADAGGAELLRGVRLVLMVPLLFRYQYNPSIPPGEMWFVDLQNKRDGKPTLEHMGSRYCLYYLDNGEW